MAPTSTRFKSGQIAFFMVAVLPVVLVLVIWTADWGILWFNLRGVQKAADGAALAGASYLPTSPDAAKTVATNYATANLENCPALAGGTSCPGAAAGGANPVLDPTITVTPTVSGDQLSMTVTVTKQVAIFLAPFLNPLTCSNCSNTHSSSDSLVTYKTITVSSVASLRSIVAAHGLLPIGIDYNTLNQVGYQAGQEYALTEGQIEQQSPAQSQSVPWYEMEYPGEDLNDVGTLVTTLISDLQNGYPQLVPVGQLVQSMAPSVTVGQGIYATNQTIASIVQQQVQQRISLGASADPGGTPLDHTPLDPRAVIFPVVSQVPAVSQPISQSNALPTNTATVNGFAMVWLDGTGANGEIDVTFINQVAPNSIPGVPQQNLLVADFGVYQPVLVQ